MWKLARAQKNSYTIGWQWKFNVRVGVTYDFAHRQVLTEKVPLWVLRRPAFLQMAGRLGASVWWLLEVGTENWSWYGSNFMGSAHTTFPTIEHWDREDSLNIAFKSSNIRDRVTSIGKIQPGHDWILLTWFQEWTRGFGHWNDYRVFSGQ